MQTNLQNEEGKTERQLELNKRAGALRRARDALGRTDHASWERPQREHDYREARRALERMGNDGKRVMWAVVLE
jgi:hypothetical protein